MPCSWRHLTACRMPGSIWPGMGGDGGGSFSLCASMARVVPGRRPRVFTFTSGSGVRSSLAGIVGLKLLSSYVHFSFMIQFNPRAKVNRNPLSQISKDPTTQSSNKFHRTALPYSLLTPRSEAFSSPPVSARSAEIAGHKAISPFSRTPFNNFPQNASPAHDLT